MNTGNPAIYLSLGGAAKASGKSKGTISKALKTGKLSYVEKNTDGYKIDPSELHRVFPIRKQETGTNERLETHENPIGNSGLQREIQLLREQVDGLKSDKEDMKVEKDRLLKLLEEQAASLKLLTDQRAAKRGFFKWLSGKS